MLRRLDGFEAVLTPWEEAQGYGLRRFSQQWPQVRNLALIVGPEGGMSPEEVTRMEKAGARPVTLGPRILRTETAGLQPWRRCWPCMGIWIKHEIGGRNCGQLLFIPWVAR